MHHEQERQRKGVPLFYWPFLFKMPMGHNIDQQQKVIQKK
jgi:hypothetical protein